MSYRIRLVGSILMFLAAMTFQIITLTIHPHPQSIPLMLGSVWITISAFIVVFQIRQHR